MSRLNTQDKLGRTPLHYCVLMGSYPITEYLLSCGANTRIADIYGKLPVDYIDKQSALYSLVEFWMNLNLVNGNGHLFPLNEFSFERLLQFCATTN